MINNKMKIATLFSGIGSPEQGASRVYNDLELVFACEWDKYARDSFKANYKIDDKHFHSDIADLKATQYKDKVDILIGGSPCQDFSLAGLRAGIGGNKGILIYEYIRVIDEVQPPVFIYENVKGMLSDGGGRTIKEFVQAFRDMGYSCHYEILNTKDYGVPQNRERIFLVGFKDHNHYHNFSFAPKIKLDKRLRDILEDNVDEKYYLSQKMIEYFITRTAENIAKGNGFAFKPTVGDKVSYTLTNPGKNRIDDNFIKEPKLVQVGQIYDNEHNSMAGRVYDEDGLSVTLSANGGGGGGKTGLYRVKSATKKGYETATLEDSINFTHPSSETRRGRVGKGVAQTLDCACNQAVIEEQDYRIRKLTPRECFRLQDFPDTFKFIVSNSQLYKQAGNSISANVMEMIFNQIEKSRHGSTDEGSLF